MEQVAEQNVNLFAETMPSLEALKKLAGIVNSSERKRIEFDKQISTELSGNGSALPVGIGLVILGKNEQGIEQLEKAPESREKYMYLAKAFRRLNEFEKSIESLDKSLAYEADPLLVNMEKASVYLETGNYDMAREVLESCTNFENVSAEYHFHVGRLEELCGNYNTAKQNYKKAIELSPNHQQALFHLAYRCDMEGDEESAIQYYKQAVTINPILVSALINLAVLYEDMGEYEKASRCIEKVLEHHPNHPRALMFLKDIESSKTMLYDEEKEKRKSKHHQILETPISDFELSVRSRNCLRKMKIHTIGDLLNITEAELLSYKNFGETSLREIKAILETKNLHLGLALEDRQFGQSDIDQPEQTTETVEDEGILSKPVDDLRLSVRARKCLQRLNIRTIGDLTRRTEAELLGCKNFGVTSLNEIKKAINGLGLSLRVLD